VPNNNPFYALLFLLFWGMPAHNVFQTVNKSVNNINYGGCGFFALYLHECLDPNQFTIVAVGQNAHILVFDSKNDRYIDSRGIHSSLYFNVIYGWLPKSTISRDTLQTWLKTKHWNPTFNRNDTTQLRQLINSIVQNEL
jgi:hypothetical protein